MSATRTWATSVVNISIICTMCTTRPDISSVPYAASTRRWSAQKHTRQRSNSRIAGIPTGYACLLHTADPIRSSLCVIANASRLRCSELTTALHCLRPGSAPMGPLCRSTTVGSQLYSNKRPMRLHILFVCSDVARHFYMAPEQRAHQTRASTVRQRSNQSSTIVS